MIDTIKIRLHGILDVKDDVLSIIHKEQGITNLLVPEHQSIYDAMLRHKGKYYNVNYVFNKETSTLEPINDEDFQVIENNKKISHHYQNRNIMRFVDEKTVKETNMAINGSYRVPSSSSDVTFRINENGGFIDFEFSIPKYIYGHSLAQFVPQKFSDIAYSNGFTIHKWNVQTKHLYKRLLKFIESFFTDICKFFKLEALPNMDYVEIRRIDLCYNQYFENKSDALLYLDNVKKLKNEKEYKTKAKTSNYGTTYALASQFGSYFKIYHKGTEYSKTGGDLQKHMKLNTQYIDKKIAKMYQDNTVNKSFELYKDNKDLIFSIFENYAKETPLVINEDKRAEIKPIISKIRNNLPFDVMFLKNEMDKVLRYEVSLYGDFFKYLYKRKVFRRSDAVHLRYLDTYKDVKSTLDTRNRNKQKVHRNDLKHYKMMHKYMSRSIHLLLSNRWQLKSFEKSSFYDYDELTERYKIGSGIYKKTILANKDVGTFSDYFLRLSVKHFFDLISKHQIKKMSKFDDISSKIRHYNSLAIERKDRYDEQFYFLTLDVKGNQKIKGNKIITKASQLLTQKELRNKRLKQVNTNLLLMIVDQLQKGISLKQYRDKAGIKRSTFHRYKQDLELFGVFESTLEIEKEINVSTDFSKYYWFTEVIDYQNKFYTNPLLIEHY